MPNWSCTKCEFTKEGRCKPRKCPLCGGEATFVKKEKLPA